MNEAAISEAVLCEAVHYGIITKRVYKDIAFLREAQSIRSFITPWLCGSLATLWMTW